MKGSKKGGKRKGEREGKNELGETNSVEKKNKRIRSIKGIK